MAGTKEGAKKATLKILEKDPDHFRRIGSRGGKNGNTGGFASMIIGEDGLTGVQRARIAGAKGGSISRRSSGV